MILLLKCAAAIFIVTAFAVSFCRNVDYFSPVKVFSVFNFVFYLDIFISSEYPVEVYLIYLAQTLLILLMVFFEPRVKVSSFRNLDFRGIDTRKILFVIWFLSFVPIVAQIYGVLSLGGFEGAIENIAYRVQYYKGLGYLLVLNSFIIVLNACHAMVCALRRTKTCMILYGAHLFILVSMGMLSGSRSFILVSLIVAVVAVNYLGRRIGFLWASGVFCLTVVGAMVLGALRDSGGTFSGEALSSMLELSHFKYGLIPLDIILREPLQPLKYGETYASLLTNFIPRSIFPDKLESGGVFFTRAYADDAWGGLSHLATGAVTEGVINFGWFGGVLVGFGLMSLCFVGVILFYRNVMRRTAAAGRFFLLVPYIYFLLLASRISFSEFSYEFFSYAISIIAPWSLVLFFYRLRIGGGSPETAEKNNLMPRATKLPL